MACSCCMSSLPPVVGTLLVTILFGFRMLKGAPRLVRYVLYVPLCLLSLVSVCMVVLVNSDTIRSRFYAMQMTQFAQEKSFDDVRCRRLGLSEVSGRVLEFGPGPGTNFRCMEKVDEWVGVEPNKHFSSTQDDEAKKYNRTFPRSSRRDPPAEGKGFDAVVITHVLCTARNPDQLLQSAIDALKPPHGKLYVMEHVAADSGSLLRLAQLVMSPFFLVFADGCKFQDPQPLLTSFPALHWNTFERFSVDNCPMPLIRPHIVAVASLASF